MLNSQVQADLLVTMQKNIETQSNMQAMVMTYTSDLSNYLNTVNQGSINTNNAKKTCRIIQTLAGCRGIRRGGGRGSGCGVLGEEDMDMGILMVVVMTNDKL